MTFGQAVNAVIEKQDINIDVSTEDVHQVVATDAQPIAVSRDQPYVELWIGDLDASGDSRRTTVDGVKTVGVHVVREPARAADAGDKHGIVLFSTNLGADLANLIENRVIASSRTPTDILIRLEVLGCQHGK